MITLSRPILMIVTEASPRLEEIVAEAMAGGVDLVQWRGWPPASLRLDSPNPGGRLNGCYQMTTSASSLANREDAPVPPLIASNEPEVFGQWQTYYLPPGLGESSLSEAGGHPRHIVNARSFDHLPAGAGGVHLPEHSISIAEARRQYGANILIGRSIHNIDSALQAEIDGANYIVAGTIFASNSHPGETPAGLDFLREVCASVTIPVIAIGGITPQNTPDCLAAGAAGVAVLSPIMRAKDPKRVAEMYCEALRYGTRISS